MTTTERGTGRVGRFREGSVTRGAGESLGDRSVPRSVSSNAVEAERALLGCVLIDEWEVWGELEDCPIVADDFLMPEHKAIWRAFRWLYEQGMEITSCSTAYALEHLGLIDAVDGWVGQPWTEGYLISLMAQTYSAKSSFTFARMVKHYSEMRAAKAPRSRRVMEL